MAISDRLRELRKETEQKQSTIASSTGLSRTSISQYENGLPPPLDACIKLADYYGVSLDWLVGRSAERNPIGTDAMAVTHDRMMKAAPDAPTASQLIQVMDALRAYGLSGSPCGADPVVTLRDMLTGYAAAMTAAAADDLPGLLDAVNATISAATRLNLMPGELLKRSEDS